jgi:hypothetical protein
MAMTIIIIIIFGVIHLGGCIFAAEQRTLGAAGGFLFGLLPIAGPILILAWQSRADAAYQHFLKTGDDLYQN